MFRLSTSSPPIGPAECVGVECVVRSGYFGMGMAVGAFEQELADCFGGKVQVACVSSETSAVNLLLSVFGGGRRCPISAQLFRELRPLPSPAAATSRDGDRSAEILT